MLAFSRSKPVPLFRSRVRLTDLITHPGETRARCITLPLILPLLGYGSGLAASVETKSGVTAYSPDAAKTLTRLGQ